MKTIFENATCETCTKSISPTKAKCRPCATQNGRPGYEPKPGIEVKAMQSFTFDRQGRPVERVLKRVVTG